MTLLKSNILSILTGWCWAKFCWPWCRPFSDFAKAVVSILIWKNEITIRNRNVGLFKFFPTVLVDFVTEWLTWYSCNVRIARWKLRKAEKLLQIIWALTSDDWWKYSVQRSLMTWGHESIIVMKDVLALLMGNVIADICRWRNYGKNWVHSNYL